MNETINHLSNNLFDIGQRNLPAALSWVNPLNTILIIDDSPVNHKLLATQLREANYHILSVTSGPEGLQVVQSQSVDLIMLDVMMPDMDGFEVCRRLKSNPKTSDIPIIFLTALRDISYRLKGIEAGGDEFLSRPHNREELLLRVNIYSCKQKIVL